MGVASPRPGAPPAVPAVQEPPSGMVRARWLYVDEALTHEVYAGVRGGAKPEFVIRESAYHNGDPDEIVETVVPLKEAWDAQFQHLELESRLALLSRYWKHDATKPGWTLMRGAAATEGLDMRQVDVALFPGDATFWHFHPQQGNRDTVIVRLPHRFPGGLRFLLAIAEMEFPLSEAGTLDLIHQRLTVGPMRSMLAREHRAQASKDRRKLVRPEDFQNAYGSDWKRDLFICYRTILTRLSEGKLGRGQLAGMRAPPDDPLYTDYMRALSDPKVAALHARFLTPDEESALMQGGEDFIKQAITRKRAQAPREDQHLLSILEASLLARDGLRMGVHKVDPEVAALVRRFAFYL